MTDLYAPTLRRRYLEDTQIKRPQTKTQKMYLRAMREFARFLGHASDSTTPDE